MKVGSYPAGASPYKALDMSGNVWEWVSDWYSSDYYNISSSVNPLGPANGDRKVLRGGAWGNDWDPLRVSNRGSHIPEGSDIYFGFRCAANPSP